MSRSIALACLIALFPLCLGCATTRPDHLPALTPDTDDDMVAAHDEARRAYDRCLADWEERSVPWPMYLATGSGLLSAALLGSGVTMALLVDDANLALRAGLVGGLSAGAVVAAGVAVWFGAQQPRRGERFEVTEQVLAAARTEADAAMSEDDRARMRQLSRSLYEDCRLISSAKGGPEALTVRRDLERYRRDLAVVNEELASIAQHKNDLAAQNDNLGERLLAAEDKLRGHKERLRGLEGKLAEKESANGTLRGRVTELEEERAQLSKREQRLLEEKRKLEQKKSHYQEVADSLAGELRKGRVQLRRLRDGVVVEMQNKVLFPSGSAELNDAGKETLAAVAGAITGLSDRRVRVQGHTDDVPVGGKNPIGDNWNLSAQRALTVTRFLQEQGVDPSLMSAEARGQYAPAASNASDEGRAKNRRIEIYLVPKPVGTSEAWAPEDGE